MDGVFRNHFLHCCWISLVAGLLFSCSTQQKPPPDENLPREQNLSSLGYTIQVGAFAKPDNAFRLCAKLIDQGLAAYYFKGDGGLYRVRFGNYASYEQALALAKQLQQQGAIAEYHLVRPETYPTLRYSGQEEALRRELVSSAQQFIGVPYQLGDVSPVRGFDCSGLTMMTYQLIGLDMPRSSRAQFRRGRPVSRDQLRPGDLVFFTTDASGQVSHVGIYQGDDLFIHAPRSGKKVSRARLSSPYFRKRYLGARTYL